jgi:hypothetical protein
MKAVELAVPQKGCWRKTLVTQATTWVASAQDGGCASAKARAQKSPMIGQNGRAQCIRASRASAPEGRTAGVRNIFPAILVS